MVIQNDQIPTVVIHTTSLQELNLARRAAYNPKCVSHSPLATYRAPIACSLLESIAKGIRSDKIAEMSFSLLKMMHKMKRWGLFYSLIFICSMCVHVCAVLLLSLVLYRSHNHTSTYFYYTYVTLLIIM